MSKTETAKNRALVHVLANSAALGPFTVAVGQLGLDGAVRLCGTREPTERLAHIFGALGYGVAQLPSEEDIKCLILAVEVRRRVAQSNCRTEPYTINEVTVALGATPREVNKGFRLLKSYGENVHQTKWELGAALGAI